MIAHGKAPFLECSSKGDARFSAFRARIKSRGNRSIEELYQAAKVFEGGATGLSWRDAKGKRATNMAEVAQLYAQLWDQYMAENPQLLEVIKAASGLADRFGQAGHCCQATELWRIRCAALGLDSDSTKSSTAQQVPAASSKPVPTNLSLFDALSEPMTSTTDRRRIKP